MQQKRKEQVEKQKLIKKIDASKLLLENDVKLLPKKPKKITVQFSKFQKVESESEDKETKSDDEPAPKPEVKQFGTSTRNAKSVKKPMQPPKPVKLVQPEYKEASYF